MSEHDAVVDGLRYIADSPPHEYGGFHPEAVTTAKGALALVHDLRAELATARATNARLNRAAQEAYSKGHAEAIQGLARKRNNARTLLAEEVKGLRAEVERLTRERDEARNSLQACEEVGDEVAAERDRYQREAMTARTNWDAATAAERGEGPDDAWADASAAYRAIRAENEKHEKGEDR